MDEKTYFYKYIYDSLYSLYDQYRQKDVFLGKIFIKKVCKTIKFNSVLDVGCSTGLSLVIFKDKNKNPTGLEVSKIAVSKACALGRKCEFGSVTKIPFKDDSFDLVFNSDLMEHLRPEDVDVAISEIKRVTKKYIACRIALRREKYKGKDDWIKKAKLDNIKQLHLSVFPTDWWIEKFNDNNLEILWQESSRKYLNIIFELIK